MSHANHVRAALAALGVVALVAAVSTAPGWPALLSAQAGLDWTQWRGPNRDGTASSFAAPATWPEQLNQRWKMDVGLGYATPLVVGPRVYMFARQGEEEVMTAIDAATGTGIWRRGYAASFTMNNATARHGPGPKSTPAFADGAIFSIGMTGIVTAFEASTGAVRWTKPGAPIVPIFTTHAFSPVVDRGLVVFHTGGNNQGALTAFDVKTGDVRWSWTGDGPSYGSPIVVDLDGTRQVITLTQTKLVGVDVATGTLLWERAFTNSSVTNAATPNLTGHTVIVSNGGPAFAFSVNKRGARWVIEEAWQNADAPFRLSNAVVAGDVLFGLSTRNAGQYFGVDPMTGATLWTSEGRQAENAAVLKSGELLFSLESDGELVVLRRSRTAFDVIKRYKVADSDTWPQPAITGNRFFVKDVSTLALWTLN